MTWHLGVVPEAVADITVEECKPGNAPRLLFSAMDASVATEIERAFAQAGHVVVSNSRNHRMERDVPLLVPEINPDHLKLVPGQQRARGWKGQIVTNPNCSTIVLTMGLAPLQAVRHHQDRRHHPAGHLRRGIPRRAVHGHHGQRRPFIGSEEEKMQQETQKILGDFRGDHIEPLPAKVSAHCNRVAVVDGHTVTVSVEFSAKPAEADLRHAIETFPRRPAGARSCPARRRSPVIYMDGDQSPAAAQRCRTRTRHGGLRGPPARPARCSITSSSRSATTPSAAPPARPCSMPS